MLKKMIFLMVLIWIIMMLIATLVAFAEPMAGCVGNSQAMPEPQNGVYLIRDADQGTQWTEVYRDGKEVIIAEQCPGKGFEWDFLNYKSYYKLDNDEILR